jgi:hypothetical protein
MAGFQVFAIILFAFVGTILFQVIGISIKQNKFQKEILEQIQNLRSEPKK